MSLTETEIILADASQLALHLKIKTLLIMTEKNLKIEWLTVVPKDLKAIIASSNQTLLDNCPKMPRFKSIAFPTNRLSRFSKIRSILIAALSKGFIRESDRIVCVNGSIRNRAALDSIDIVNMNTQFKGLKYLRDCISDYSIQLNVLASVFDIAIELGEFGREGKSCGAIFILGDAQNVLSLSKQIVFNPFSKVDPSQRNIKNSRIKENILEFSKLDGAFIVRGNGVICSAGRLLFLPRGKVKIISGLGSRHNAAAHITKRTKSIGIVVSESTGSVSVFVKGKLLFRLKHSLMEGRSL